LDRKKPRLRIGGIRVVKVPDREELLEVYIDERPKRRMGDDTFTVVSDSKADGGCIGGKKGKGWQKNRQTSSRESNRQDSGKDV
jgi:hypothetical protein